jgi:hypothetical protein
MIELRFILCNYAIRLSEDVSPQTGEIVVTCHSMYDDNCMLHKE